MTDQYARNLASNALKKSAGGQSDVSKEYVDNHLDKKVDKIESTSANPRVYGVSEEAAQTTYFATQTPDAHTIPMRDASGRFQVADGIAPKQVINKGQLDAAMEAVAKLADVNVFTEMNTFAESSQFNKGLESDGNVSVTNAVFKVMNNSDNGDGTNKDYVALYDANKINLEENGSKYELVFPKKSGTFATIGDLSAALDLKVSEFKNVAELDSSIDTWQLTDDNSMISLLHDDDTSTTAINLSKGHIGLQTYEEKNGDTESAVIAFDSGTITLGVNDTATEKSTTLTIDENGATLNNKRVITETDIEGKVNTLAQGVVAEVYVRNEDGEDGSLAYTYSAEGNTIAKRSASGTLAVETPTQPQDAANKAFVETQCANIPKGIVISDIAGSTSGVLAEPDFQALAGNPNNYILKDGKKYERSSERPQSDSLTYVYNGYLSNRDLQESIEITVSAKSWVLNSSKIITDKIIANGRIGGVSIKNDFADGLEVSQTDGNLSIYGALDADIAARNSKRPITTINLNKAVIAALSDDNKEIPTPDQQAAFKAAWGITASMFEGGIKILDLAEISVNATQEATSGTIKDDAWGNMIADEVICLKLNNEYYLTSDDEHTPGVKSFTHVGWNGNANQMKSINITKSTKAWALKIGYSKYYRHYIKATLSDSKILYYDFSSTQSAKYTLATLPVQPDDSHSQFTLLVGGYYSTINGQIYRDGVGTAKAILNGLYTTNGSTVAYLMQTGTEITEIVDDVKDM